MDTIISRYEDNGSVRYDGKEYVESHSKVCREKSVTGVLQIDESVTMKTKSRIWKIVVVDPESSAATNSASQSSRKRQADIHPLNLLLLNHSPNSLFLYSVPFCSQDSGDVLARYFSFKV